MKYLMILRNILSESSHIQEHKGLYHTTTIANLNMHLGCTGIYIGQNPPNGIFKKGER
jgi:hypothetical protein